jgi:hypothetical protein
VKRSELGSSLELADLNWKAHWSWLANLHTVENEHFKESTTTAFADRRRVIRRLLRVDFDVSSRETAGGVQVLVCVAELHLNNLPQMHRTRHRDTFDCIGMPNLTGPVGSPQPTRSQPQRVSKPTFREPRHSYSSLATSSFRGGHHSVKSGALYTRDRNTESWKKYFSTGETDQSKKRRPHTNHWRPCFLGDPP